MPVATVFTRAQATFHPQKPTKSTPVNADIFEITAIKFQLLPIIHATSQPITGRLYADVLSIKSSTSPNSPVTRA